MGAKFNALLGSCDNGVLCTNSLSCTFAFFSSIYGICPIKIFAYDNKRLT